MKALVDLHTHSIASGHAYSTIKENIDYAKETGLKVLGISDHGPNMPAGAHEFYFNNLRVLRDYIDDVRILKGIEANIINLKGDLDVDANLLEGLDYAIASFHPPCIEAGTIEENTEALVNVMKNKYVKIIGHPDDSRFPLDYERIVKSAKENKVLLEVNNSSLKPNGFRLGAIENAKKLLEESKKYNNPIILGSDSHVYYDIGNFDNCLKILKEVNFPEELVINYNVEKLLEYILK